MLLDSILDESKSEKSTYFIDLINYMELKYKE